MTFYNTIDETSEQLVKSKKQTARQEDRIYSLFVACNRPLSPSMVLNQLALNCPITSIRRAMTNLTNSGKIIKTDQQVKGLYGKAEHLWMLPDLEKPVQVSLFASSAY